MSGIPRASMDDLLLAEHGMAKRLHQAEALLKKGGGFLKTCMKVMVLNDRMSMTIWAYPVRVAHLPNLDDLDTCGYQVRQSPDGQARMALRVNTPWGRICILMHARSEPSGKSADW